MDIVVLGTEVSCGVLCSAFSGGSALGGAIHLRQAEGLLMSLCGAFAWSLLGLR